MGKGSGDRLARGAVRATFGAPERKMTDAEWAAMFEDYNPDTFEMPKKEDGEKETIKNGR
jgi:hypothetical protein